MTASNEKTWYIWRNGSVGPFTSSNIRKVILAGSLKPHDVLSPNDGQVWIRADNLFDFSSGKKISDVKPYPPNGANKSTHTENLHEVKTDFYNVLHSAWKIPLVRIVVIIGVLPLLASRMFSYSTTMSVIFWGCYFSALWGILIWEVVKPGLHATKSGFAAGVFTICAGIPLLYLLQDVIPITSDLYSSFVIPVMRGSTHGLISRLTAFIIVVGICEEVVKLLPVIILSRKKENRTFPALLWLSIISGLGFAIAENISYSYRIIINNAAQASTTSQGPWEAVAAMAGSYGSLLTMQLIRFITLPILHAAWVGIAACFLTRGYQLSKPFKWGVLGILCAAGLHGFYNAASAIPFGSLIMATATLLIFAGYVGRLLHESSVTWTD